MQKSIYILTLTLCILVGCNSLKRHKAEPTQNKSNPDASNFWPAKDPVIDGIPGISLQKLYRKNKVSQTAHTIVVAVLDTQIDSNHEDLQGRLWINKKEIPNNGIDDDHNGYIDDVNGWNFIGKKNGSCLIWGNSECVRIVRKWESYFKDKNPAQFSDAEKYNFRQYQTAVDYLGSTRKFYQNWNKSLEFGIAVLPAAKEAIKTVFPNENYTLKDLDSLYSIYKTNDKSFAQRRDDNDRDLGALINYMRSFMEVGQKTAADISSQKTRIDSILQKNLNLGYNERDFIQNNQNRLEKGYGNNTVSASKNNTHNTQVSGIIAANRNKKTGIQGFSNQIKIMPISVLLTGDEHDLDIAMAIYYAVDNGAKVINMSFGKELSLEQDWVTDAIRYAEKKNVLIIHGAGNSKMDVDKNPYFPSDYSYSDNTEISSNFINVGATTHTADSTLVYKSSNYGRQNVDLFAPGANIYTLTPGNQYAYDSGTSLAAPMVSGTAALIWLYYPNLSLQEVKQIILDSGVSYDLQVLIPGGQGKKAPFKNLSKSGKVLNVYNAMETAKQFSSRKNASN